MSGIVAIGARGQQFRYVPVYHPTGARVSPCVGGMFGSTLAVTANRLYAMPAIVGLRTTFSGMAVKVQTLAAGNVRLGCYNHDETTGLPGSLAFDAGTASTGTTGEKVISSSQALNAGRYWLAAVFDATPTIYRTSGLAEGLASSVIGFDVFPDGASNEYHGVYRAFTYAALPDPFGGSLTMATSGTAGLYCLVV